MTRALLASFLAVLMLAACTDPCVELANQICECETLTSEVDDCKEQVTVEQARIETTSADQDRCEALLDTCTCEGLATPEGKQACGMAR